MQRFFIHNYKSNKNKYNFIFLLAFFILLAAAPETLQAQKLPELIPYRKGDKWGYCDSNKKIIIPPVFKRVDLFDGDVAIVSNEFGQGLIDKTGMMRIGCVMQSLALGPENSVMVRRTDDYGNYKFGMFNRQGVLKIPIKHSSLEYPSEGICLYRDEKNRAGYIDTHGKVIVQAKYVQGKSFHSGRAVVDRGTYFGCTMGYIDRKGNEVISAKNAYCDEFINGMASIERCNGKYEVIDTSGKVIFSANYATVPRGKLTPVRNYNKYGYMDSSFKLSIPAIFESAGQFHERFAVVQDSTGKRGLINEKGNKVIPFNYRFIDPVDSGSVIVGNSFQDGIKYGLFDTQGKLILPLDFRAIQPMSEGLISACKDGKCGYYDLKGKIVIPFQYTQADRFKNGMAIVYSNKKTAIIDRKGNYIIPFKYDGLGRFENRLFKAYIKDKEFYIDKYGNEYYEEE